MSCNQNTAEQPSQYDPPQRCPKGSCHPGANVKIQHGNVCNCRYYPASRSDWDVNADNIAYRAPTSVAEALDMIASRLNNIEKRLQNNGIPYNANP